ncbi:TatD family hydrolase [Candidatus Saccharibacteria bacterium]|nr:TatD family hydrolase [Candidatus Saccharibacteria bacterium]
MQLVDTHCHPHFDVFLSNPEKFIDDASAAGVTRLIAVGTTLADSERAIKFADAYKNVWASAGVHPHDAEDFLADPASKDRLNDILNQSSIVAVGEIGLDYYKMHSGQKQQLELLRLQLELGKSLDLPFIFHVRDAWEDFWPAVDEYPGIKGVIHSFSADEQQLENALSRGFFIGLNGIMTFSKDETQLDAAKKVPLQRLLLETDAPFLAPKPYRGSICEPKHIRVIAEFLAQLRDESFDNLASSTTANAVEFFGLEKE